MDCVTGFPGYYYPNIESVHEELEIFRTNEFLACRPYLTDPSRPSLSLDLNYRQSYLT
jgi:hypothetical protein